MEQYIPKSAVVAEITRRIKEYNSLANTAADNNLHNTLEANELLIRNYKSLISFLDSIEVKEVDLEKEIRRYRMRNPIIQHREESLYDYMANVAKHFFELGLQAQKE